MNPKTRKQKQTKTEVHGYRRLAVVQTFLCPFTEREACGQHAKEYNNFGSSAGSNNLPDLHVEKNLARILVECNENPARDTPNDYPPHSN